MGRIYKRGNTWWIQYYRHGQLFRESSQSPLKSVASTLLKMKEGDVAKGLPSTLQAEKTTFEDLTHLYIQDYEIQGRKTLRDARRYVKQLGQTFSGLRAMQINSARIMAFVASRRAQGLKPSSVNRELEALKRMFRLGAQQQPPLVLQIPHIQKLKENNARTGFFEHEEFLALRGVAPDHLKVAASIAYWTGMRAGEILALTWDRVDQDEGFIRLEPGTTKTDEGRLIPLMGDLPQVLEAWWRHTRAAYPGCPWVIHYRGRRVKSLYKRTWKAACDRVGLKGKLFHDFRRTAIRNMIRAGISEHVAMKISGHKTRSVFDRYDIVSENDLRDAKIRMAEKMKVSTTTSTDIDWLEGKKHVTT